MMRYRAALAIVMLGFGYASTAPLRAAQSEQPPVVDPHSATLQAAVVAMQAGKSQAVLDMLAPALVAYEAQYASEKRRIYCGMGSTETLLYMTMAASEKRDAVAIQPNWCAALYLKAFALIDQKQFEAGLAVLKRVVDMAPQHAHYLNELGYVYQSLRRSPESLDAYSQAAEAAYLAPKGAQSTESGRALRGMGFILVEQGKWDEAEVMYRKCLKLDPDDAKAKAELQYIAENRPKRS